MGRQGWAEWACILALFILQGAWPVPEVNEPYYLGKALHYWHPESVPGDFFLETADSHTLFYFTFGWLAGVLPLDAAAWVGRLVTWALLAWGWLRLSRAVIDCRWAAVLTAGVFLLLNERLHMAGEWVVGGVEAKGLAYVLVFFGLEALVRDRWNRAWLLLGAASAFHVLVGGWSVAAAGLVWLGSPGNRPALRSMLPGLAGGFALSLVGLVSTLTLTWGVDGATVAQANALYVYERLAHHLAPDRMPWNFPARFAALTLGWVAVGCFARTGAERRLAGFVWATLVLAGVGLAISFYGRFDMARAAGLLRFYWFRLSDVAVPMGVALVGLSLAGQGAWSGRFAGRALGLALGLAALGAVAVHMGIHAGERLAPQVPRSEWMIRYDDWRTACEWIALSGAVPPDARFLTPKESQTFRWRTGRAEVVNWKEIPQDAGAIAEWWERMRAVHGADGRTTGLWWFDSLAHRNPARLLRVAHRYGAGYVITENRPRLPFERLYFNRRYAVYRLPPPPLPPQNGTRAVPLPP